jgi:proteasome alpha subunit
VLTPYDWQEGIGNRAQYIETKLSQGIPVVAISLDAGILIYTRRRQGRKIYEVYDRLVFAGIGQQSDVEAMRIAAVDFASQEGFNRSEQDVTIQRVATALSNPLKRAFGDFGSAPLVARTLFAELNESPEEDLFYALDYDGDFVSSRRNAVIAGTEFAAGKLRPAVQSIEPKTKPEAAMKRLQDIWGELHEDEENDEETTVEAVMLDRMTTLENRFRRLTDDQP